MEKFEGRTEKEINTEPYNFWNRDKEKENNDERIVYYWEGKEFDSKKDYVKVYTAPESSKGHDYRLSGRYKGKSMVNKGMLARDHNNKLKAKSRAIKFMFGHHYHYDY